MQIQVVLQSVRGKEKNIYLQSNIMFLLCNTDFQEHLTKHDNISLKGQKLNAGSE
jgi:hypothetical protein